MEKWLGNKQSTRQHSFAQRDGQGVLVTVNRERYTGEFVQGLREGHGKCEYPNGDVYEGIWKASQVRCIVAAMFFNSFSGRGEESLHTAMAIFTRAIFLKIREKVVVK